MAKTLTFRIQQQVLSNWCWAATTLSIVRFYKDPNQDSQCEFVSKVTYLPDCCQSCHDDGENSVCNQTFDLGSALWQCGHGVTTSPESPKWDIVVEQIDNDHPVACNVIWDDGGAHAIVICGYTDDGMLLIADPEKPGTLITVNKDFIYSANYEARTQSGKIKETFRTK